MTLLKLNPSLRMILSLLLAGLSFSSCEQAADPDDGGNGGTKTVSVTEIADLPMMGGAYTDVEVFDDGIAAILDGKLMFYDLNFTNGQIINDNFHYAIGGKDSHHLYAVTESKEIRTYDLSTKSFASAPYSIQYNISEVEFRFNSQSDPYVVISHGWSRGVTYYSKDKGGSWLLLKPAPIAPATYDISFDQNDNPLTIAPDGVFRTTDEGATWTNLTANTANFQGLKALHTSDGALYIYVKGAGGFKRSMDNGANFTDVISNLPLNVIDLREGEDGALYAIIAMNAVGSGYENATSELMRSTDQGATWKHLLFCNSNAFSIRSGKIAVINGGFFSTANGSTLGGAFLSSNAGATWETRGTKAVEGMQDFALSPSGEIYMIAENTIYKRVGDHWETFGMNRGRFGGLTVGKDNKLFLSSTATSDLFDPVAGTIARGLYDYTPSLGGPGLLGVRTLKDGSYLVSIGFYYNNYYSSGVIVRVTANGILQPNGSTSFAMQNVSENPDGLLYGSVTFQVGVGQQFETELYTSADGGVTWTASPTQDFAPVAFSKTHVVQRKGAGFTFGPYAELSGKDIVLDGFNWTNERPGRVILSSDNRLYLLSLDVSTSKNRIVYTTAPLG